MIIRSQVFGSTIFGGTSNNVTTAGGDGEKMPQPGIGAQRLSSDGSEPSA